MTDSLGLGLCDVHMFLHCFFQVSCGFFDILNIIEWKKLTPVGVFVDLPKAIDTIAASIIKSHLLN